MNYKEVSNIIDMAKHKYICDHVINPEGKYYLHDVSAFKQPYLEQLIHQYGYDPTEGMCLYYNQYSAYLRLHQNDTVVINGKEKIKMSIILDFTNNNDTDSISIEDIVEIAKMAGCSVLYEKAGDNGWITEELVKEIYNEYKGTSPKNIIAELHDKFTTMASTSILVFTTEDDSYVTLKKIDNSEFITNVHRVIAMNDFIIDPVLGYGPVSISNYVDKILMIDKMEVNYEESIIGDNRIHIADALVKR